MLFEAFISHGVVDNVTSTLVPEKADPQVSPYEQSNIHPFIWRYVKKLVYV